MFADGQKFDDSLSVDPVKERARVLSIDTRVLQNKAKKCVMNY